MCLKHPKMPKSKSTKIWEGVKIFFTRIWKVLKMIWNIHQGGDVLETSINAKKAEVEKIWGWLKFECKNMGPESEKYSEMAWKI